MDCLDKVEKKVVDKKSRKPRTPKAGPEEITSKMVSDQFDKMFLEFKKLESLIFKPPAIDELTENLHLEPVVKKVRAKKSKPLTSSSDTPVCE